MASQAVTLPNSRAGAPPLANHHPAFREMWGCPGTRGTSGGKVRALSALQEGVQTVTQPAPGTPGRLQALPLAPRCLPRESEAGPLDPPSRPGSTESEVKGPGDKGPLHSSPRSRAQAPSSTRERPWRFPAASEPLVWPQVRGPRSSRPSTFSLHTGVLGHRLHLTGATRDTVPARPSHPWAGP